MSRTPPETSGALKPPVALGCIAAIVALIVVVLIAVFFVVFLNSGSANGPVTLADATTYADGTVTYSADNHFYVVRLPSGNFVILADLDAANRESQVRKCRIVPMSTDDPNLSKLIQQYSARLSPEAASTTFLFTEACNNAIYDITGARLDSDGPNLDRYASSVSTDGKLVVDTRERTCTQRSAADVFAQTACPP